MGGSGGVVNSLTFPTSLLGGSGGVVNSLTFPTSLLGGSGGVVNSLTFPTSLLGGSGGVVNSLTFARHPLAALTSGAYKFFFTMEGSDSEFANFTLLILKAFLKACSQNVSDNKQ